MDAALLFNSFPVEVLERIFQALEWPDRVRVERVCKHWQEVVRAHSWDNVHHFDDKRNVLPLKAEEFRHPLRRRHPLLERLGSRITSVLLRTDEDDASSWGEVLHTALTELPNLKHLHLDSIYLNSTVLTNIQQQPRLAQLKSFSICFCGVIGDEKKRQLTEELNAVLRSLTVLEYLHIDGRYYAEILRFHAPSMAHIRHLSLHCYYNSFLAKMLRPVNLDVVVALPSLCSLTLGHDESSDLTFLQRFHHLQHLKLGLSPANLDSFVALTHIGQSLRALEIMLCWRIEPASMERVLLAVAAHFPHLEHLGLCLLHSHGQTVRQYEPPVVRSSLEPRNYLATLLGLRSLELDGFRLPPGPHHHNDFSWLESMGHLERLALHYTPPLPMLCAMMEKCKRLHTLLLDRDYLPSGYARRALDEAAASNGEEGNCGGDDTPPVLRIRTDRPNSNEGSSDTEQMQGSSRLRFCEFSTAAEESHLLRHYKYGCLSDGRPEFADAGWQRAVRRA